MIIKIKRFSEILEENEDNILITENNVTSPIDINNMTFKIKTYNVDDYLQVDLLYDNKIYQKISVDIPDTKKLNNDEFFMNPDVHNTVIKELIKQNFIEKSNKKSKAGTNIVFSYRLV